MELQKIILENFKCFKSKVEIDLEKLTLLTGANSSGKSSIIYSILGAIQSGEFPFQFSTNGKYVNMGDFSEVVFDHNKKKNIKLGYTFTNGNIQQIDTEWKENPINKLPELVKLIAKSDFFEIKIVVKNQKYIIDFKYETDKDPKNKIVTPEFMLISLTNFSKAFDEIGPKTKTKITDLDEIKNKYYNDINFKNKVYLKLPSMNKNNYKSEDYRINVTIDSIIKLFNDYCELINFISSFRLHPERGYLETSKAELKVGNDGRGYLDQIVNWENIGSPKLSELISIIQDLGLLSEIKTKRTEGGKFDLHIKTKKNGVFTSLYDVGFGISQFLPILVADLQLPNESTLFIAQPEIHLHPSVQSTFGDYLIKQISKNNKRYIIETHSEYLLNKIRLAIVKNEIAPEDVNFLFLENNSNEAKIHKIEFCKNGQIKNAPKNFFETYMIDVMEIALNATEVE